LYLHITVDVLLVIAMLGGKIVFPHWTKYIEVTIPEGTKNGKKMRLKELGIIKGMKLDTYS
jgi:DnaJ-class molecular chaperone